MLIAILLLVSMDATGLGFVGVYSITVQGFYQITC
jgi:hypothetical protein